MSMWINRQKWRLREIKHYADGAIKPYQVRRQIKQAVASQKPIIVGPWISEVGYELLYWVPFLKWAQNAFRIPPERLIVVSRGGTHQWYQHITANYVDIFDFFTADEFRAINEQRIIGPRKQKQISFTPFDQQILSRAIGINWVQTHSVLHPLMVYQIFRAWYRSYSTYRQIQAHTSFHRYNIQIHPLIQSRLPEKYVSVKFYSRPSLPETDLNQVFIRCLLQKVAKQLPVVLLNTGLAIDDHSDFDVIGNQNIIDATSWMTPSDNLDIQTQIIARSEYFLGTYGGLSYLPVLCGVPAFTFYSENNWRTQHLKVLHEAIQRHEQFADFAVLKVDDFMKLAHLLDLS